MFGIKIQSASEGQLRISAIVTGEEIKSIITPDDDVALAKATRELAEYATRVLRAVDAEVGAFMTEMGAKPSSIVVPQPKMSPLKLH